jgi:hypothetical protein
MEKSSPQELAEKFLARRANSLKASAPLIWKMEFAEQVLARLFAGQSITLASLCSEFAARRTEIEEQENYEQNIDWHFLNECLAELQKGAGKRKARKRPAK